MRKIGRYGLVAVLLGLGVGLPGRAEASFFIDFSSATAPSAGVTAFVYTLSFNANDFGTTNSSQLKSGDFVTLYDFGTFLTPASTVVVPTGFSYAISLLGKTPTGPFAPTPPADDPTINNLTFTYTGATLTASTTFNVTITLPGLYSIGGKFGNYESQSTYQGTSIVYVQSSTFVPTAVPSAVPEPSSLALCGLAGLVGLACSRARRRAVPA